MSRQHPRGAASWHLVLASLLALSAVSALSAAAPGDAAIPSTGSPQATTPAKGAPKTILATGGSNPSKPSKPHHGSAGKGVGVQPLLPANGSKGPVLHPSAKQQAGRGKQGQGGAGQGKQGKGGAGQGKQGKGGAGQGKQGKGGAGQGHQGQRRASYPMSNKGRLEPRLGAQERLELSLRLLDHLRTFLDGSVPEQEPQLSEPELHRAKTQFLLEMGVQGQGKGTGKRGASARRLQGELGPELESSGSGQKGTSQKVSRPRVSVLQKGSGEALKEPLEILRGLGERAMGAAKGQRAEVQEVPRAVAQAGRVRAGPLFEGHELMRCDGGQLKQRSPKASEEEVKAGGVDGMRFWFLLNVTEQLSKARMHLYDSISLANRLGRTIVLPNVGGSKIDARQSLPFCTYYDVESISQLAPWVTQDFLISAYRRLQMLPRVLLLILGAECPSHGTGNPAPGLGGAPWFPEKMKPVDPVFSNFQFECFGKKDLGRAATLAGGPGTALGPGQGGGAAQGLRLQGSESGAHPSRQRRLLEPAGAARPAPVVALTQDSPFFAYDQFLYRRSVRRNSQRIAYAPHLVRAGARLVGTQGESFLAVQWRFERLFEAKDYGKRLDACGRGLLESARAMQQKRDLKWVFFASDIGPDGALLSSSMDRPLAQQQLKLAREWRRRIEQELKPVTWHSVVRGWDHVDSGVKGILDKVVCGKATAFLHPPRQCEGSISVFLRDILASRQGRASEPWRVS